MSKESTVLVPVSPKDELPNVGDNVLVSYDGGKTYKETLNYRAQRTCMLAGVGGGYGYFGEGFCTDGSTGCETGLIMDMPDFYLKEFYLSELVEQETKGMDEIINLIDNYWKFDNNQQPQSNWHDKQDLLEQIRSLQSSPSTKNLLEALEQIRDGSRPYNVREMQSWVDTAIIIASQALNNFKK